uniref:Uncharacterized protein n=1 Tax=Arion vulgaris TaxID=1028688 RepID=A0A0B7B5Z6_9EUPU
MLHSKGKAHCVSLSHQLSASSAKHFYDSRNVVKFKANRSSCPEPIQWVSVTRIQCFASVMCKYRYGYFPTIEHTGLLSNKTQLLHEQLSYWSDFCKQRPPTL